MPVTLTQQQLADLKVSFTGGALAAQVEPYLHLDAQGGLHVEPHPIAALYNSPAWGTILIPSLSRDDFLLGILPAGAGLFSKDQAVQEKWKFYLDIAKAASAIRLGDATIQAILGQLVTDGLMEQSAIDAFTRQPCSYAESLFDTVGIVLHTDDIQAASELP